MRIYIDTTDDEYNAIIIPIYNKILKQIIDLKSHFLTLNYVYKEKQKTIYIPYNPFMHWIFNSRRKYSPHQAAFLQRFLPEWEPVSPCSLKMSLDDPCHSDWFIGAGLDIRNYMVNGSKYLFFSNMMPQEEYLILEDAVYELVELTIKNYSNLNIIQHNIDFNLKDNYKCIVKKDKHDRMFVNIEKKKVYISCIKDNLDKNYIFVDKNLLSENIKINIYFNDKIIYLSI